MIKKTDAIRIVSINMPDASVILHDKTIERKWGWLFFWARRPDPQSASAPMHGMYIVNREDGTGLAPDQNAAPASVIAAHERALLGGEVVGRVKMLLGASFDLDAALFQGLRFPISAAEAANVHRTWSDAAMKNYRLADVEVNGERIVRDVTFDRDSGIAVLVDGKPLVDRLELFGCAVTRMLELGTDMKDRKVSEAQRNAFASPAV